MGTAVAGAVVAGGLALSAAGRPWATVTAVRPRPLPPVTDQLTGGQVAPLVSAMGLLLLAGAVAVFAVRGRGRVVVGAVIALAGLVLAWSGLRPLVAGVHATVRDLSTPAGSSVTDLHTTLSAGWPLVVVVAGVLAVLAGALVVLRGGSWPAMGRRYERPGGAPAAPAREPTDEERATAAWRALDRGEDPTAT
jgi:uncharacterized membrane protein (TIGR02234 family)